jgi:hypothetical protein
VCHCRWLGFAKGSREPSRAVVRERPIVALWVTAWLVIAYRRSDVSNSWLEMQVVGSFPEGASQFIEKHHLNGPLFNDFNRGGFLIWRLPQLPVAMDGRTNVQETIEWRTPRRYGMANRSGPLIPSLRSQRGGFQKGCCADLSFAARPEIQSCFRGRPSVGVRASIDLTLHKSVLSTPFSGPLGNQRHLATATGRCSVSNDLTETLVRLRLT